MDPWFNVIAADSVRSGDAATQRDEVGLVIPGPVASLQLSRLAAVYDAAVSAADRGDVVSRGTQCGSPSSSMTHPAGAEPVG
jgi:hypothetical protein